MRCSRCVTSVASWGAHHPHHGAHEGDGGGLAQPAGELGDDQGGQAGAEHGARPLPQPAQVRVGGDEQVPELGGVKKALQVSQAGPLSRRLRMRARTCSPGRLSGGWAGGRPGPRYPAHAGTRPNSSAAAPASRLPSPSGPTARRRAVGSCSSLLTMARAHGLDALALLVGEPVAQAPTACAPPRRGRWPPRAGAGAPARARRRAPRAPGTKRATSCATSTPPSAPPRRAPRRCPRRTSGCRPRRRRAPSPAAPPPGRCRAAPPGPP